jgi:hypothetical protein
LSHPSSKPPAPNPSTQPTILFVARSLSRSLSLSLARARSLSLPPSLLPPSLPRASSIGVGLSRKSSRNDTPQINLDRQSSPPRLSLALSFSLSLSLPLPPSFSLPPSRSQERPSTSEIFGTWSVCDRLRSSTNVEGGRSRANFGTIDTANRYRRRFYVVCSLQNAVPVPGSFWFIVSGCRA